ncbi:MAG: hypothetical protein HY801_07420 [Candidatus Lindowbacteria bacterium]|nr:hypothetical protein [Candidatus Lindowbacteria bacterium]
MIERFHEVVRHVFDLFLAQGQLQFDTAGVMEAEFEAVLAMLDFPAFALRAFNGLDHVVIGAELTKLD